MTKELSTLQKTNTCELVRLPPRKCAISSRSIYVSKTRLNGLVEHYKEYLVAKGFFPAIWYGLGRNVCSSGQDEQNLHFYCCFIYSSITCF